MYAHACLCLRYVCEKVMSTSPCGLISSPLIQKWKENIRTPEVPLKQRCSETIKTRKEKKIAIFKTEVPFSH